MPYRSRTARSGRRSPAAGRPVSSVNTRTSGSDPHGHVEDGHALGAAAVRDRDRGSPNRSSAHSRTSSAGASSYSDGQLAGLVLVEHRLVALGHLVSFPCVPSVGCRAAHAAAPDAAPPPAIAWSSSSGVRMQKSRNDSPSGRARPATPRSAGRASSSSRGNGTRRTSGRADRLQRPDAAPQEQVERLLVAVDGSRRWFPSARCRRPSAARRRAGSRRGSPGTTRAGRPTAPRGAPGAPHAALGLGDRVVAVRLAGARDRGGAERVRVDREARVGERGRRRRRPRAAGTFARIRFCCLVSRTSPPADRGQRGDRAPAARPTMSPSGTGTPTWNRPSALLVHAHVVGEPGRLGRRAVVRASGRAAPRPSRGSPRRRGRRPELHPGLHARDAGSGGPRATRRAAPASPASRPSTGIHTPRSRDSRGTVDSPPPTRSANPSRRPAPRRSARCS